MYKRMQVMDTWSEVSVGLRHHADADMLLKRIAKGQNISDLRTLGNYIEPAQYYARNWEKWISTEPHGELYNQYERLNRFVDALPVESMAVYEMQNLVQAYGTGDESALDKLQMHYQKAQMSAIASKPIFADNVSSVDTVIVADKAKEIAELGLELVEVAKAGDKLSESDAKAYQAQIDDAAIIFDETIVAIVRPTEQLLQLIK